MPHLDQHVIGRLDLAFSRIRAKFEHLKSSAAATLNAAPVNRISARTCVHRSDWPFHFNFRSRPNYRRDSRTIVRRPTLVRCNFFLLSHASTVKLADIERALTSQQFVKKLPNSREGPFKGLSLWASGCLASMP